MVDTPPSDEAGETRERHAEKVMHLCTSLFVYARDWCTQTFSLATTTTAIVRVAANVLFMDSMTHIVCLQNIDAKC